MVLVVVVKKGSDRDATDVRLEVDVACWLLTRVVAVTSHESGELASHDVSDVMLMLWPNWLSRRLSAKSSAFLCST